MSMGEMGRVEQKSFELVVVTPSMHVRQVEEGGEKGGTFQVSTISARLPLHRELGVHSQKKLVTFVGCEP